MSYFIFTSLKSFSPTYPKLLMSNLMDTVASKWFLIAWDVDNMTISAWNKLYEETKERGKWYKDKNYISNLPSVLKRIKSSFGSPHIMTYLIKIDMRLIKHSLKSYVFHGTCQSRNLAKNTFTTSIIKFVDFLRTQNWASILFGTFQNILNKFSQTGALTPKMGSGLQSLGVVSPSPILFLFHSGINPLNHSTSIRQKSTLQLFQTQTSLLVPKFVGLSSFLLIPESISFSYLYSSINSRLFRLNHKNKSVCFSLSWHTFYSLNHPSKYKQFHYQFFHSFSAIELVWCLKSLKSSFPFFSLLECQFRNSTQLTVKILVNHCFASFPSVSSTVLNFSNTAWVFIYCLGLLLDISNLGCLYQVLASDHSSNQPCSSFHINIGSTSLPLTTPHCCCCPLIVRIASSRPLRTLPGHRNHLLSLTTPSLLIPILFLCLLHNENNTTFILIHLFSPSFDLFFTRLLPTYPQFSSVTHTTSPPHRNINGGRLA
ncbi:hypothetical protein VP01_1492g1 [Puccinia sorghi]|uniref:Uncharacterized protein n=1 Tax=Puccinia sorghi TaxID=27349 RepID=A0A0L6VJH6_9BASI|nr:hypothetical protein VP01_1492g1 [Puccinia sorghi]